MQKYTEKTVRYVVNRLIFKYFHTFALCSVYTAIEKVPDSHHLHYLAIKSLKSFCKRQSYHTFGRAVNKVHCSRMHSIRHHRFVQHLTIKTEFWINSYCMQQKIETGKEVGVGKNYIYIIEVDPIHTTQYGLQVMKITNRLYFIADSIRFSLFFVFTHYKSVFQHIDIFIIFFSLSNGNILTFALIKCESKKELAAKETFRSKHL